MNINIAINEFAKICLKYELRFPDLIFEDNKFIYYVPKTTTIPYVYYLINQL